MREIVIMIGVVILIVIIIGLVINLARAKFPIQRVEQNRMFSFLSGMLGYTKDNPLNGSQLGDYYQESRTFKKDGVKISIQLSKDNERPGYSFKDRKEYYNNMKKNSIPGSKEYFKADNWIKKNNMRF